MEEKDVVIKLSEQYNKKRELIEKMVELCYKFDYESTEAEGIIQDFLDNEF